MESGNITKPIAVAAPAASARADGLATAGAVKAELAPDEAVQQAVDAQAVRFELKPGATARAKLDAALREVIERHLTVDPKTREVVFQAVDPHTSEVVRQVPDAALLRLRTYLREMRDADAAKDGVPDGAARVEKIA